MNRQTEYILTDYITPAQKKELVEYLDNHYGVESLEEIIDNLLLRIAKFRARNIWIKQEDRK